MDPEKDNTTALQYLEVTVSIGTGTVSLPSVLSFYFDLFTLSLPVALQRLVFDCLNLQSNHVHGAKDPAAAVQCHVPIRRTVRILAMIPGQMSRVSVRFPHAHNSCIIPGF